ncbi:hypothetical protein B0H17DRAFT_1336021 [Mycena rosella]|uniref:Wax synthase domain-containing protein n=1 Tax=Mycena rosella TaxID=1033263 RepID=A0AAD7CWW3_MYCRO|nr:hypothetical protein B0H17DRAFT_1336021 [Mycena rosella]
MATPTIDRTALSRIMNLGYAFVFFNILALVVKPSPYRRLLFLPLLVMSPYLLSLSTGYGSLDYGIANVWFVYLFAASDFILLTDVQRELRIVKPPQRADEQIENAPLARRIAWATQLFANSRGIGWAHEPRCANPPHPAPSAPRGAFVRAQIAEAVAVAVLGETVNFFNMRNPALYGGGPGLAAAGWPGRLLAVWAWGLPMAALSMCGHSLNAAFSVGTGTSDPEDWPPFMGSLALSWSVRSSGAAHGTRPCADSSRRTATSAYTHLYIAFLISGIMHYLPEYMALRHWGGGALLFFLLQAVAITFEDGVQAVGRRLGIAGDNVREAGDKYGILSVLLRFEAPAAQR